MVRDVTAAAAFLGEVLTLLDQGWTCLVDLNKRKNRDYCDEIGMPYQMANAAAKESVRSLSVDTVDDTLICGPNPDLKRKSLDHFYEFSALHDERRVFLRFKIDRDRGRLYFNSFHGDTPHLFLSSGRYR
ncbi:MAG: hypothetical protein GX540_04415 [Clostridiales bacterium]|nr:hypothetical protein [Clostridiales bacterium]